MLGKKEILGFASRAAQSLKLNFHPISIRASVQGIPLREIPRSFPSRAHIPRFPPNSYQRINAGNPTERNPNEFSLQRLKFLIPPNSCQRESHWYRPPRALELQTLSSTFWIQGNFDEWKVFTEQFSLPFPLLQVALAWMGRVWWNWVFHDFHGNNQTVPKLLCSFCNGIRLEKDLDWGGGPDLF